MGGEYLVELLWRAVSYGVRSLRRRRKLRKAVHWRLVEGLVRSVTTEGSLVEVLMTYEVDGGYFCDYHERDLFLKESAREYASRFPLESSSVIRINPARPEEMVLFEDDQITPIAAPLAPAVRS